MWAVLVVRECGGGDVGIGASVWIKLLVLTAGEVATENGKGDRPVVGRR